jgi:peptidoglycan/xylan/chitin deacetylase (PgdA/CDA1 family)
MTLLHTKQFSSWARGHLVCSVQGVPDQFALTFDDGPNGRATGALLDVLAKLEARATFFMLGPNVRRNPELVRRLVREGHEPAVHGESHLPLALLPPWSIRAEVLRCAASIEELTGVRPRLFRPPFGFMMPGQSRYVRGFGFDSVLGSVYPEDPAQPGVDSIVERVMPRLRGGSVLILHDGSPVGDVQREQTVKATAIILERSAQEELTATTVSDLLASGAATPQYHTVQPGPPQRPVEAG